MTNFWLFQANPKYYDLRAHLATAKSGDQDLWTVSRYAAEIQDGDPVAFWQSGPDGGLCALGTLLGEPHPNTYDPTNPPEWVSDPDNVDKVLQVPIRFERILNAPISRHTLLAHPVLSQMLLFKQAAGTNFKLTPEQWTALEELVNDTLAQRNDGGRRARPSSWYHLPILALAALEGGRPETTAIYGYFEQFPDFNAADLAPYKHQPNQPLWQQNLRIAQQQLKTRGDLSYTRTGGWALTAQGAERLRQGLEASDGSLLELEKIGITFDQIQEAVDNLDLTDADDSNPRPKFVITYRDLRETLDTWASEPLERQKKVDLGRYYVYDVENDTAAPSKFVGYRGMSIDYYDRLVNSDPTKFDGGSARRKISQLCGDPVQDPEALAAVAALQLRHGRKPNENPQVFSTKTIYRLLAAMRRPDRHTLHDGSPTAHNPLALLAAIICTSNGRHDFTSINEKFLDLAALAGTGRITINEPYTRLRATPSRDFFWTIVQPDGTSLDIDAAPNRLLEGTHIRWESGADQCINHPAERRQVIEALLDALGEPAAQALRQHPEVSALLDPSFDSGTTPTIAPPLPDPTYPLDEVVATFSQALAASHIHFGPHHDAFVRSFVVSLATKRFVILTGLSGSGKTQIGLKLGHWLDRDRTLVVPVRPDWTGGEALFGYEDALGVRDEHGNPSWHVPEVLGFMLAAHDQPHHPYILVLDEMNLAHVERYFADVLSGMESGEPCLPNLRKDTDGYWRTVPNERPRVALPKNLFVVGTVNVDETTYMFSPKVLDRANVIEIRVTTDDLVDDVKPPAPIGKATAGYAASFLDIASSPAPAPERQELDAFRQRLREIHALLSDDGFEFGHRVYHEATRFAALHAVAGGTSVTEALDLQVMQKLLPRLHGSRRQLETLLLRLARYCETLDPNRADKGYDPLGADKSSVRLTRSFEKVCRMLKRLRANQFVSFTE